MNKFIFFLFSIAFITITACKPTGCRSDVLCVDNYNEKAERDGECDGCATFGATNYCPEATRNNGTCVFMRKFYTEVSEEGWVDIWVSDSAENADLSRLVYEGKISNFPVNIPDCESSTDSTLVITRFPGEYYFEIETQTGKRDWGWVIYREEGCRLLDIL
tara:strand:- start:6206 stop:6688 length:483 start_codon:yes stop_codon:yes gene_type:complete